MPVATHRDESGKNAEGKWSVGIRNPFNTKLKS